jgi:hypothetical protein
MDLQQISQLTHDSLNRLTSDAYKSAFEDQTTGAAFRARINELENGPKPAASRPAGNVRADAPTPTPGMTSFDPSFDDSPNPPAPAAAPAPTALPAQPAAVTDFSHLPLQERSHQPMINGKPAGGLQTFKFRTVDDPNDPNSYVAQLQRAHSYASARIRELSRNKKLEEIVAAGPTAKNFTPSTEVPKTMEELAKELLEQRQQNFLLSVREALNAFQLSADWAKYRSHANAESVVLAVERLGLSPAEPQSYHTAFQHMKAVLEPVVAAEPAPTPDPTPAPVAATPAVPTARAAQHVGVSTGISDANAFNGPDPFEVAPKTVGVKIVSDNKTQVMTLEVWSRLSSDAQKRILRSSANAAAIETLYTADNAARQAAARGR